MSNIAKNVTVVHRRNKFRAEAILVDRLMAKSRDGGNVRVLWDHTLDEVIGGAKGVTGGITVNPAAAASFTVSAPTTAVAGSPFSLSVTAKDAFGNVATGFNSSVTLTSSDGQTVNPGTVTLTNGTATVPVTLDVVHAATGGAVYLTASSSSGKGNTNHITVSPGAPAVVK